MVLIGLLLPMTEAFQHKWHMTIYNMASLLLMLLLLGFSSAGICFT